MSKKTLFIVEGWSDEPQYIERLIEICFPTYYKNHDIFVFDTNIHQLPDLVMEDGVIDENIELLQALKSRAINAEERAILSQTYNDVFLIFDFDPHDTNPAFESIQKMLAYYTDSTDMGRLYINYPMMQSYRHLKALPDNDFLNRVVDHPDILHYKELVGQECLDELKQMKKYDYETFVTLTAHHLLKAQRLLPNLSARLSLENYHAINYADIYALQVKKWRDTSSCYVLNTATFLLIDYQPQEFFRRIVRHCADYRLPLPN